MKLFSHGMDPKAAESCWRLLGFLGKAFVDLLFATTPIDGEQTEAVRSILESRRYILSFWHSRLLLFSYLGQGIGGAAMVSRSDDGEIIARILEAQGQITVRGSTSRGGARALARMIRVMKEEHKPGVVIPDGPRGPRFQVQPGVVALARKTGYPILPATYSARHIRVFSSWDRFILPVPFTRCRVVFGEPVRVCPEAGREEEERCRQLLESILRRITLEADRGFGHHIV
jgi:hypothetical protein